MQRALGAMTPLQALSEKARACTLCPLPHPHRPVFRVSETARILIAGQAPGVRVQASGKPFTDPSGDRLRAWMGVDEDTFYDASQVAILPMGFCFPGLDAKGGDLPPRRECAPQWREAFLDLMPNIETTLLVGGYALRWAMKTTNVTDAVRDWRRRAPVIFPLPHPSWRNNAWLKCNPWFETETLPALRGRLAALLKP